MKKVYYKDGAYIVVPDKVAWEFENDTDWDRTEDFDVGWEIVAEANFLCSKLL